MTDVKISAVFTLQGSVLPAEPPCSKKGKKKKNENESEIFYRQETVHFKNSKPIVVSLREAKPASQTLHLCQGSYEYMKSADNPAGGVKPYEWKRLSANKRIKYHLQDIAHTLNGKLESFKIIDD